MTLTDFGMAGRIVMQSDKVIVAPSLIFVPQPPQEASAIERFSFFGVSFSPSCEEVGLY